MPLRKTDQSSDLEPVVPVSAHIVLAGQTLWYDKAGDGFADFKIAVFDNPSVLAGISADTVIN